MKTIGKAGTRYGRAIVQLGQYSNGTPAIQLIAEDSGEPIGKLSVNIVDQVHLLKPGEFFVKDYGENEFLYVDMMDSPLFEDTFTLLPVNPRCPIWRIKS